MLGQVNPTPFDLYFPLFGIQVRVTPWFWLAGLFLGYGLIRDHHFDVLMVWLGCVFFSILIHELGHALAGRLFGWPSDIFLYHFGGVTRYFHQSGATTGRLVAATFAGPWAGFVLFGMVVGLEYLLKWGNYLPVWRAGEVIPWQLYAIRTLKWLNLYWGLINLLPVLPLDGGWISKELLEYYRPRDGLVWCLRIGMTVAGLAAAFFFLTDHRYAGIFFALFAIDNFQRLEQYRGGGW